MVAVERWTDQRARGWYSGESHIHANYGYGHWYNSPRDHAAPVRGRRPAASSNFMVANSDGDGVFDREYFRGRPDPLSNERTVLYWNEEFRSTIWGHMTLLNLDHLVEPIFTGFAAHDPALRRSDQRRRRRPDPRRERPGELHPPRA